MAVKYDLSMIMKERGLTNTDLANEINVHPTTISGWRLGTNVPWADNREKVNDFFGVEVTYPKDAATKLAKQLPNVTPKKSGEVARLEVVGPGKGRIVIDKVMPLNDAIEVLQLVS